jgi:hypothetical protein
MKHPEPKSEIFLCVDENQACRGREFARVFSKYEVQILRVLYNVMPNGNLRLRLPLAGAGAMAVRLKRLAGAYALAFYFDAADYQLGYPGFPGASGGSNHTSRPPPFLFYDTSGRYEKVEMALDSNQSR